MEKKTFKMADAILTVICVVFVAEAAAPVAALGNSPSNVSGLRALFPDGFAPSPMAKRPSDGALVNLDVGRGRKRAAAVPFSLDRAWVEAKAANGFRFERGRNGDTSGWDTDGGYALRYR